MIEDDSDGPAVDRNSAVRLLLANDILESSGAMSGTIAVSILSSVRSCACNMYDSGARVRHDSETYRLCLLGNLKLTLPLF